MVEPPLVMFLGYSIGYLLSSIDLSVYVYAPLKLLPSILSTALTCRLIFLSWFVVLELVGLDVPVPVFIISNSIDFRVLSATDPYGILLFTLLELLGSTAVINPPGEVYATYIFSLKPLGPVIVYSYPLPFSPVNV